MTDIRERVARAILETDPTCDYDGCKARLETEFARGNTSEKNWWDSLHAQADNALLACGYDEMRKALADLVAIGGDDDGACVIANARAILERTGDKP